MADKGASLVLVTAADQVIDNIRRYQTEIGQSPNLQSRLSKASSWYAYLDGGQWLVAPSKFVGYQQNDAETYLKFYDAIDGAHGGKTESAIGPLGFVAVDPRSRLGKELEDALAAFFARFGKRPRADHRISVLRSQLGSEAPAMEAGSRGRISIDPDIAGGRPCITGTRMRVSDIIEMLAAGADTAEILADYPYLDREDISAALAYAAQATAHRVILAA